MAWLMRGDDWEMLDGIPRWVWRADDLFSKMSRDEALHEVPKMAERMLAIYGRDLDRLLRMIPRPTAIPAARLREFWMASQLEECRRRRNLTTGVLQVDD